MLTDLTKGMGAGTRLFFPCSQMSSPRRKGGARPIHGFCIEQVKPVVFSSEKADRKEG